MNENYPVEQSPKHFVKSRSSSGERDDSFEVLCLEDESDAESDSFTEVTADEINCLENRKEENTFSLFDFPSRVLKYFNPIAADRDDEELQEDEIYLMVASETTEESEASSKELQETDDSRSVFVQSVQLSSTKEAEPNNNEVSVEENQREVAEDSENSEVEYNFPELDREEMYLKARPHGLGKRKRYTRSIVKLKGLRNVVRVV